VPRISRPRLFPLPVVARLRLALPLVAALAATQRGLSTCQSLLRAQLGQRVNEMILEKALTLDLRHFEDSEFYDKLTRARREASSRPLSLVMRSFGLVQNGIALVSFGTLPSKSLGFPVPLLLLTGPAYPVPSSCLPVKFGKQTGKVGSFRQVVAVGIDVLPEEGDFFHSPARQFPDFTDYFLRRAAFFPAAAVGDDAV
jgi:hypothetical protein